MRKVVKIVLIVILTLIASVVALVFIGGYYLSKQPSVPTDFETSVQTGGEIEATYLAKGTYEVSYIEQEADAQDYGKYEIYYPAELSESDKVYPVLIVVNGTGVPASKYPALLEHFASWGFIIIGNEQEFSWQGDGADASLDYLLRENENTDSVFYGKVDADNIGIVGHSQGGVGVFNGITIQSHSGIYKAAAALSPTSETVANNLNWSYDSSAVSIPMLMVSGTAEFEVNSVIPHEELCTMYEKLSGDKVMARITDAAHEQTLYKATGYVTAWFMWQLQGDEEAANAFVGDEAELLSNDLYQDVQIDID